MARRADAGAGFLGKGSAAAPSPSARRSGGELSLPPLPISTPKKSWICTNPVAMPVDGRGACPPPRRGYATDTRYTEVFLTLGKFSYFELRLL